MYVQYYLQGSENGRVVTIGFIRDLNDGGALIDNVTFDFLMFFTIKYKNEEIT